jgi:hypothetical protein
MAALMIEVEEDQLWQGEAKSFTAWVKDLAEKAGVPERMLWRYLRAGRYYNDLRDGTDPELAAMPALGEAPCKADPESLELLEKISRVAPAEKIAELAKNTVAGDSTRQELRDVWKDYQASAPDADQDDPDNPGKTLMTDIRQALRASRGRFLDASERHQWTLHAKVSVAASCFDAVGVELATPEQPRPGLHGVQIAVEASAFELEQRWAEAAAYVDTLWLAVPAALSQQAQAQTPSWVGVVAYHELLPQDAASSQLANRLQVARPADPHARHVDLRGELALELLRRML